MAAGFGDRETTTPPTSWDGELAMERVSVLCGARFETYIKKRNIAMACRPVVADGLRWPSSRKRLTTKIRTTTANGT